MSPGSIPVNINAPAFPRDLEWINSAALRMDQQKDRVVLVEFWDFCRYNSLNTLPYLEEWHNRYSENGLRVIGIHSGSFPPSRDNKKVADAVKRIGITYPVVIDENFEIWDLYGNRGWPGRYIWDQKSQLAFFHYGEGAYEETEREIQRLLSIERKLVSPLRAEDEPGALLALPKPDDLSGPYSGPYEAGSVWATLEGNGTITVNGDEVEIDHPGCYQLIKHEHHSTGTIELILPDDITCHATYFAPGLAESESNT